MLAVEHSKTYYRLHCFYFKNLKFLFPQTFNAVYRMQHRAMRIRLLDKVNKIKMCKSFLLDDVAVTGYTVLSKPNDWLTTNKQLRLLLTVVVEMKLLQH